MLAKAVMRLTRGTATVFVPIVLLLTAGVGRDAVTLDALGLYVAKNGYGGARLVHLGNFYHLPIQSNGKSGNLMRPSRPGDSIGADIKFVSGTLYLRPPAR